MLFHLCHFVRKTRGIPDDDFVKKEKNTVNVDIFALFIFLRNSRFISAKICTSRKLLKEPIIHKTRI